MNRWVHFDGMIKFYISHWCQVIKHTDAHAHFELSSTKWWMITLVVRLTINEINKTVV
jgi:hypothetical protein